VGRPDFSDADGPLSRHIRDRREGDTAEA